MAKMDYLLLWTDVVLLLQFFQTASTVDKHLMIIQSGSGSQFDSTWLLNSFNDDNHNKSDELYIDALLLGGEFKAFIDPAWGDPEWVNISYLNPLGDYISQTTFYVLSSNITMQTAWMISTFDFILPFNIASDQAGFTPRDGEKEMLVRDLASLNTYQAIIHEAAGSEFIIAANASQSLVSGSATTGGSLGCKPTSNLNSLYQTRDSTAMTVETCVTLCETSTYVYVGLKFGTDCYCVNVTLSDLYTDLPAYCPYVCTGNDQQLCGGSSDAYMSVYNVTTQADQLESLGTVQTATLISVSQTAYTTQFTIDIQTDGGWSDDYMYITGIQVIGHNSTLHDVKYSFQHYYNTGETPRPYTTALNEAVWVGLTGVTYDMETLLIRGITILFLESTGDISVNLIGPSGSDASPAYVTAEYILVSGSFVGTTSSTSTPTSSGSTTSTTIQSSTATGSTGSLSTSTSTVSSPTSTPSVSTTTSSTTSTPSPTTSPQTNVSTSAPGTTVVSTTTAVYSNLSILINGELYCPCKVSNNTTSSTIDIEAIIANLTLDKDTLSATTRRYNSAEDNRPSAKTLGALGVIVISVAVGCIVAMDSANLVSEVVKIKKNYRFLKKQLSKKKLKVDDISTISQPDPNVDTLSDVSM